MRIDGAGNAGIDIKSLTLVRIDACTPGLITT